MTRPLTASKAITAKCLSCRSDDYEKVRLCEEEATCPLWPRRMGFAPHRMKPGSVRLAMFEEAERDIADIQARRNAPLTAPHTADTSAQ